MKPFSGWYEASCWVIDNASGPCMVLTHGKVWQWFGDLKPSGVIYMFPYSQRKIYGGINVHS